MLVLLALALVAASVVSAPDLAHAQPTPNRAAEYTADERPWLRCGIEQALDVDFEGTGRLYRAEWRRCGPPRRSGRRTARPSTTQLTTLPWRGMRRRPHPSSVLTTPPILTLRIFSVSASS